MKQKQKFDQVIEYDPTTRYKDLNLIDRVLRQWTIAVISFSCSLYPRSVSLSLQLSKAMGCPSCISTPPMERSEASVWTSSNFSKQAPVSQLPSTPRKHSGTSWSTVKCIAQPTSPLLSISTKPASKLDKPVTNHHATQRNGTVKVSYNLWANPAHGLNKLVNFGLTRTLDKYNSAHLAESWTLVW